MLAFITAAMLTMQACFSRSQCNTLVLVCAAMLCSGLSQSLSIPLLDDEGLRASLTVPALDAGAYLLSASAMVLLYRPGFPRRTLVLALVLALLIFGLGHLFWPGEMAARAWAGLCQLLMFAGAAVVILNAQDALAPRMRQVAVALCIFCALAGLPPLLTVLGEPATALSLDKPWIRLQLLIHALTPVVFHACITGVMHSRLAQGLRHSADVDMLTGAHSRRYLFETGEKILSSQDKPGRDPATLLLIDVDHFKRFNDTWGHALGDNVLRHCVSCIRDVVRAGDTIIGRYGGEEFCVLLPSIAPRDATLLAERIRRHIANNPYQHGDLALPVTVSIGIAHHVERGSMMAMLSQADERLYRAKHAGRNRVIAQGDMLVPV